MGFLKSLRQKRIEAKAKRLGMTVPQYLEAKAELKRKEGKERAKHEKWLIEEKYRKERKRVREGKKTGPSASGLLKVLAGEPQRGSDPLGLFGSKKRKRKTRKRRKK